MSEGEGNELRRLACFIRFWLGCLTDKIILETRPAIFSLVLNVYSEVNA